VSQNKSICYLTFDSLNEGVGQSQILPLLKGISKEGYQVSVMSFEKIENQAIEKELRNSNVRWIQFAFGSHGFKGLPRRIYLMAKNLPKADLYHCRSDLPVLALALRKEKNFLWDVRSLWYEQKIIVDGLKSSKLLEFVARRIEKFAAKNASAVNTLAEPLLEVLVQRNGVLPEIQAVIPTCVDTSKFQFVKVPTSENLILLSGTWNNFYDIEKTKKVLGIFHDRGFKIEWAKGVESLQGNLDEDFIKQCVLKHSEMPFKISQASFGIAICRTDFPEVLKGVMPTKIAEFFAVGRPVIVSRDMGDLNRFIEDFKVGVVIQRGMTEVEVVERALELLKDEKLADRCRKVAEEYFSMQTAVSRYLEIYAKIMS
jgi:glycosyltransferase involved in cell wall biosynthesis